MTNPLVVNYLTPALLSDVNAMHNFLYILLARFIWNHNLNNDVYIKDASYFWVIAIKYCIQGNNRLGVFFRPFSPLLSAGVFKTWRFPMSQTISLLTQLCLGHFKCRRAKMTWGENSLVYSINVLASISGWSRKGNLFQCCHERAFLQMKIWKHKEMVI